jgi:hypothetical protein
MDGCPHWAVAEQRVLLALRRTGHPEQVRSQKVTTLEEADRLGFRGSPSILVDGDDLFPDPDMPICLSCRLYQTTDGLTGVPTIDQLVEAIRLRLD